MTPHPSKDGRDPLTREKILAKAVELLDAEGIQGLSMRRLGDALGVEAMSLYRYFPNKDAILDGVARRIVELSNPELLDESMSRFQRIAEAPEDAGPPPAEDWKTAMRLGLAVRRRALEAHPKAAPLFLGRQYSTVAALPQFEAPLTILHAAGFRGQELVDAAHAIFAYAAGWFVLASGQGGSYSGPSDEAIAAAPDAAPLAAALAPGLRDWTRGFDDGLLALLDGLETRLSTSPAPCAGGQSART